MITKDFNKWYVIYAVGGGELIKVYKLISWNRAYNV